jgi:hypothetical protein
MAIRRLSTQLVSLQTTTSTSGAVFLGANSAIATSVTIPAHQRGDVIVVYARNTDNNVPPSAPTSAGTVPPWILVATSPASQYGMSRGYYFVATSSSHTSGTWTNTVGLVAAVVRRACGVGSSGSSYTFGTSAASTTSAVTLTKSTGSSLLCQFHGWGDAVNLGPTAIGAAPTGYTQRTTSRTTSSAVALNTKNISDSAAAVTQTVTIGNSVVGSTITVEVLAL